MTVAVDIGGTKIAAARIEGARVLERRSAPSPMHGDYARIPQVVAELCGDWLEHDRRMGIASAGLIERDRIVLVSREGRPSLALGAAIACPARKVIALQADGGGMYTLQALWSMAREQADVTTIILNNGSYAILNIELMRVGVQNAGPKARSMLDLTNPALDWCKLAEGMGVPGTRVTTAQELRVALAEAMAQRGPRLIEAML